jgi:SnoaL-like domain
MWNRRIAIVKLALVLAVVAGIAGAARMYASQNKERAAAAPTLTALDYFEIQQLVNRYAFAIDTCSNNGYDYADLYTPDGIFYYGINARTAVGREQLAEAAGGGRLGCKKLQAATPEKPLQTHVTVNLVIEPSSEGATGKSYLVYPGVRGIEGDPNHSGHVGGYQDVYVKTPQGWRIKKRIHIFPPDVPGSFVFPH